MENLFEPQDLEYDRRCLEDDFFKYVLFDDDTFRDEDEIAAREAMFDKLVELAVVVKDEKKKLRKRK